MKKQIVGERADMIGLLSSHANLRRKAGVDTPRLSPAQATLLDGGMFFPFAQLDGELWGGGGAYWSVTKPTTSALWAEVQEGQEEQ